jgi:protein gp37
MTNIEWTDTVWNPIRGCSMVSAGCENCYAMKQAHRFSGPGQPYEWLTELGPHGPRWTGTIKLVPELLDVPLHWKKPRRIFVNSMSDLFHDEVPDEFLDRVFAVMALRLEHTFQILTKRPARMRDYLTDHAAGGRHIWTACQSISMPNKQSTTWPLPNVWMGVSVEDEPTAEERLEHLVRTPAAVRFVSYEPALAEIKIYRWLPKIQWLIVGGESGPGARPCNVAWIRSIKDQCQAAKVPVFVKQLGSHWYDNAARRGVRGSICVPVTARWDWLTPKDKKGGDPSEWPADLRVREWPG